MLFSVLTFNSNSSVVCRLSDVINEFILGIDSEGIKPFKPSQHTSVVTCISKLENYISCKSHVNHNLSKLSGHKLCPSENSDCRNSSSKLSVFFSLKVLLDVFSMYF